MPSQIVVLPAGLIDTVTNLSEFQLDIAFGSRDMHAKQGALPNGTSTLRIDVDRLVICPEVSNWLHDDVYAILIVPNPESPCLAQPTPLPDAVVRHVLDDVKTSLTSLPHLTGHDKMAIASAISDARSNKPVVLPKPRQTDLDKTMAERLQRAADMEKVLKPELVRLDGKLARYGEYVRKHGLEAGVTRLGLQSELGAALRLDPSNGESLPRLCRRHRCGSFHDLWQSTQNTLAGFQDCLDRIHRGSAEGSGWIGRAILPLHSTLLHVVALPFHSGRYRSPQMRIRSPFGATLQELALPAEKVPEAIDAFAQGFDQLLWSGIHPLVRAGMAHIELMAIHPFWDGNGRLGRLLLLAMLVEDFLPGLPLEAVITWNRDAYLERVDAAICKADLLAFMQFLMKAVDKAIDLGRRFVPDLMQHRDALFPVFMAVGGRFATIAAEHAASMVLGPDEQLAVRVLMDVNSLCNYLAEVGLDPVGTGDFDLIGHRIKRAWSSPVARRLLIAPPAKF